MVFFFSSLAPSSYYGHVVRTRWFVTAAELAILACNPGLNHIDGHGAVSSL